MEHYDAVSLLDVIEHIPSVSYCGLAAFAARWATGCQCASEYVVFSDYDRVQGHVRRYTPGGLAKLFDRCEVETEAVQAWAF